jgi:hypothetical protein
MVGGKRGAQLWFAPRSEGILTMKKIAKFALGAVAAGVLALSAAAPAEAGVSVGVGIGVPASPGPGYGHYCRFHPCGRPGVGVGVGVGPVGVNVGVGGYVAGRGYWDGHGWYGHRWWGHGGWHYR